MRLAVFFLVLIIALPILAQSSPPAADTLRTGARISQDAGSEDASAGDMPTEESEASTEVAPPTQPSEAPAATMPPTIGDTILPTATLFATDVLPVYPTEALTATSTITAALSATATATSVIGVIPSPMPEPFSPTAPPIDLPFPTVDLSSARTALPTVIPLTLPALATFDDGASDWLASPDWSLQSHENGLAWVTTSTSSAMLYWQAPISLHSAAAPVTLSFQSRLSGNGLGLVLVSTDGLTWQSVSPVPASEGWASVSVDLSGYVGTAMYVGFSWQGTNVEAQNQWALDTVLVAAVMSTATLFSPTEAGRAATTAPMPATQVSDIPTNIVPTPEPTTTSTESIEVTVTEPGSTAPVACDLDVDGDGTITESDLSTIGRAVLNTDVNETTMIYDQNGNHQVDIGDLQEMASYLFAMCPK